MGRGRPSPAPHRAGPMTSGGKILRDRSGLRDLLRVIFGARVGWQLESPRDSTSPQRGALHPTRGLFMTVLRWSVESQPPH